MAWSRHGDTCVECGTNKIKHHAGGLCRSCYTRDRARRVGRWPEWLSRCMMCGGDRSIANYRSAGLCKRCHAMASSAGVLVFWRTEVKVRRRPEESDAAVIMREIAMMTGSTEAATRFGLCRDLFRSYVKGETAIPNDVRDRAYEIWMGV